MIKNALNLLLIISLFSACNQPTNPNESKTTPPIINPTNKVVQSDEIVWQKLNPARGDQSPQAGTIWGDRNGNKATGFLAKFVDGFSSPPHIHNVTYRAVVIKGQIHNDGPKAEPMWMGQGSFWTQPKGEPHITAAKGQENIAYVEIDHGPYLVKPTGQAFDSGERPVNVEASNVVWLGSQQTNWVEANSNAEISFLWERKGKHGIKGLFVKLPKGFEGKIESNGNVFRAVVIKGKIDYYNPKTDENIVLDSGSYFSATEKALHEMANVAESDVVLYIRTNEALLISSSE